jgi:hypothetical protein
MIRSEKAEEAPRVAPQPPTPQKGGRKKGQIYVTSVRHAKKELIAIYNELKRGEIDPPVAQARRAVLATWINVHHLNLEEEVIGMRAEMAAYRELMRQKGLVLAELEGT